MQGPNAALFIDWRQSSQSDPPCAVYFFKEQDHIRRDVDRQQRFKGYPRPIQSGSPPLSTVLPSRLIDDGWTGGLTMAPSCALSVNWNSAGKAPPNRKNCFFLGDLYARWDVKSHSNNDTQDIASGWKGWPAFG